jgi:hypothetical protein
MVSILIEQFCIPEKQSTTNKWAKRVAFVPCLCLCHQMAKITADSAKISDLRIERVAGSKYFRLKQVFPENTLSMILISWTMNYLTLSLNLGLIIVLQ